jgi:hypothetical protein
MPLECVEVQFPDDRSVFIDGNESGRTNRLRYVNTGSHRFHLGDPKNYQPSEIIRVIENTSSLTPAIIKFEKV